MTQRSHFEKILAENKDDDLTRSIFADWLDENDEPEEADRMRRWRASKEWLLDWVCSINYRKYEYDENGDRIRDADGNYVSTPNRSNLGDPHDLDDVIAAGHSVLDGDIYCWGSDAGADYFREDPTRIKEWLYHWSMLTGVRLPEDLEEYVQSRPFRCAC